MKRPGLHFFATVVVTYDVFMKISVLRLKLFRHQQRIHLCHHRIRQYIWVVCCRSGISAVNSELLCQFHLFIVDVLSRSECFWCHYFQNCQPNCTTATFSSRSWPGWKIRH